MECISCKVEINPKWTHAIDINICPFCGEGIMEEHLKNLLTSLRETMLKLKDYPDQVNDWMLSNFNFIKTDSPKLPDFLPEEYVRELKKVEAEKDFVERKQFIVKVKTEAGEEDILAEKIQTEDKTNDFFKRAEVVRPNNDRQPGGPKEQEKTFSSVSEKTRHLKDLKKQIEREGAPAITNEEGLAAMINPNHLDSADPETVAKMQSLLHDGGGEVASSLGAGDDDDAIPSVVMAMANRAKGKGGNSNADIAKLQQMHDRVATSRENFENGTNRGSKGGGFSRA